MDEKAASEYFVHRREMEFHSEQYELRHGRVTFEAPRDLALRHAVRGPGVFDVDERQLPPANQDPGDPLWHCQACGLLCGSSRVCERCEGKRDR
jgi:hypothetical protein